MKNWTLTTSAISIGFVVGAFGHSWYTNNKTLSPNHSQQVRLGVGTLTNPLLDCEIAENVINAEKINFKSELENFIKRIKSNFTISEVAVYFRDLNNGPTFGIDQDVLFIPASLLKVPIMMAHFKKASYDPNLLQKKLLFSKAQAPSGQQTIIPRENLVEGEEYTIDELIERMIIYSDNEALVLLFEELPINEHRHIYKLLGVDSAVVDEPTASLSVKQYAAFLRILFNSSFLSQEYSEKALTLLSKTDFDRGIRSGVPKEITVAHKFGERQINLGEQHFHDCGIIYYPKHPYLLCIMTRGAETPALERTIADVSDFVYKKIDEQYADE